MKTLIISFTLLVSSFRAFAQTGTDDQSAALNQKFRFYSSKDLSASLFAHFDKTIYANSENVWFTAYLLNSVNIARCTVLAVCLVNDKDHSIFLQEKFVMSQGIAFGNILLPDSIPSGNYSFILYANAVFKGKPTAIFTQPITIKNTAPHTFNAFLQLLDTSINTPAGSRRVQLVTDTHGSKIISGLPVSYYIGNKLHPVLSGKVLTDNAGQYLFDLPVKDLEPGNNVMEATIRYGKETRNIKLVLPVTKDVPVVKFYPEGGNLTAGLVNTVGWEIKNTAGVPVKTVGVLYNGSQPIDTIVTNAYGMGRFKLIPQRGSNYHVKLVGIDAQHSIYELPSTIAGSPEITIAHALAEDSLKLLIKSKQKQRVFVAVHNYRELFFLFPVEINAGGRPIIVDLTELPKGITAITVLDSLQRPCAERLFFAHYRRRPNLSITTDAKEYLTRQKVRLKLKLKSNDSIPATGYVSVACVQASRFNVNNNNDIESYLYLTVQLGKLSQKEFHHDFTATDKAYLEDALLIRGWRKYSWTDLTQAAAADTALTTDTLNFKGVVTRSDKELRKPANLLVMRTQKITKIATDARGNFLLRDTGMTEYADKKVYVFVANNDNEDYDFKLNDPYKKINESLAAIFEPADFNNIIHNDQIADDDVLKGTEHAIHLKEVMIKDNAKFHSFAIHANDCGDYVCRYNILNCRNHANEPDNTAPIPGQMYTINGVSQMYTGCTVSPHNYNHVFKGIYYAMQFYGSDYEKINPSQPEYVSTIFWTHLCKFDSKGETELSFFTSDITGPFKIVVQGVTSKDVVYAEKTINVIKKH